MFKIGDFSKLSRVSVRMLRYYDEMALLKPAQVDNFTGYRYYSASQLTRLNRILALRDLGLSLEQVAQLLSDDLSPEQLRGMLKLKRSELRQQLAAGQQQLERIERWLEQEEVIMPTYNVVLKQVEPLRVAQARAKADTMQTLGPTLDKLFDAVMSFISSNGAKFTSPGITVY
jgi:DNA-binding transcriptional MerR regulator